MRKYRGYITRASRSEVQQGAIIARHRSQHVVIFQSAFHLQWMQFSQHSEAVPFYHGYSNPIGRAVEIPHISIYMSALYPTYSYRVSGVNFTTFRPKGFSSKVNIACVTRVVIQLPWAKYIALGYDIKIRAPCISITKWMRGARKAPYYLYRLILSLKRAATHRPAKRQISTDYARGLLYRRNLANYCQRPSQLRRRDIAL